MVSFAALATRIFSRTALNNRLGRDRMPWANLWLCPSASTPFAPSIDELDAMTLPRSVTHPAEYVSLDSFPSSQLTILRARRRANSWSLSTTSWLTLTPAQSAPRSLCLRRQLTSSRLRWCRLPPRLKSRGPANVLATLLLSRLLHRPPHLLVQSRRLRPPLLLAPKRSRLKVFFLSASRTRTDR
jgi:hypothetical protein